MDILQRYIIYFDNKYVYLEKYPFPILLSKSASIDKM